MNWEESNKGLPTNFRLSNGKHVLTGGVAKIDDNLMMFLAFIGWFRVFSNEFVANILWLHQKTTNQLLVYKSLFRLNFLRSAQDAVPNAEFTNVDFPINFKDRRQLTIDVQYKYKIGVNTQIRVARFVKMV